MTYSKVTTTVVFTLAVLSVVRAFVPPAYVAKTRASGSVSSNSQRDTPKAREETAVGPLQVTLSLGDIASSIGDIFDRDRETSTTLPQDPDADKAARLKQLEEKREDYRWSTEGIPVGTPYLEGFPPTNELPSISWITSLVSTLLRASVGTLRGSIGASEIVEALSDPEKLKNFGTRIRDLFRDGDINDWPFNIDDYSDLHAFPLKLPQSSYDYEKDEAFARNRLQGQNCVVLKKCTADIRKKLKILDTDPSYKELKNKVDSLIKNGKLFVVDHELIADMPAMPIENIPRYLAKGVALFEAIDDDLLSLKVIGIQLSQGDEPTPIFMPGEGYNWEIAKVAFEAADSIIHEIVSHLGNTHVVLEGPLVAVNRQLPKEHPIYDLLKPHLEGTAFINWGAQNLLIAEGGSVDTLHANDIKDSWTLALTETVKRISKDFSPIADFEERQVTKKDFPGRYPYRDIGIQYWEAIYTWVKEYLDIYYTSEKDVTDDYELKGFVDELVEIGAVAWLEEFYTTSDKKGLITKYLASLIYSASVLHAAVNFPQKPIMSYVPSCPFAMYAPLPTDKKERTFEDYLKHLPPLEIAKEHVSILTLLGSIFYTKLGEYEANAFDDDRVKAPLAKFQATIEDIEDDIIDANAEIVAGWRKRGKNKKEAKNFGYTTLLPDKIPQSINI